MRRCRKKRSAKRVSVEERPEAQEEKAEEGPHRLWAQPWFTERLGKAVGSLTTLNTIAATSRSLGAHMSRRIRGLRVLDVAENRLPEQQRVALVGGLSHIRHLSGVGLRTASMAEELRSLHLLLRGKPPAHCSKVFLNLVLRNRDTLQRLEIDTSGYSPSEVFAEGPRTSSKMAKKNKGAIKRKRQSPTGPLVKALLPAVQRLKVTQSGSPIDVFSVLTWVQQDAVESLSVLPSHKLDLHEMILFYLVAQSSKSRVRLSGLRRLCVPEELIGCSEKTTKLHSLRVVLSRPQCLNLALLTPTYKRSLAHLGTVRLLCFDLRGLTGTGVCDFGSFDMGGLGVEAVELRLSDEEVVPRVNLGDFWMELFKLPALRRLSIRCHVSRLAGLTSGDMNRLEAVQFILTGSAEATIRIPPSVRRLSISGSGECGLKLGRHVGLRGLCVRGPRVELLGGFPALEEWRLGEASGRDFRGLWEHLASEARPLPSGVSAFI